MSILINAKWIRFDFMHIDSHFPFIIYLNILQPVGISLILLQYLGKIQNYCCTPAPQKMHEQ